MKLELEYCGQKPSFLVNLNIEQDSITSKQFTKDYKYDCTPFLKKATDSREINDELPVVVVLETKEAWLDGYIEKSQILASKSKTNGQNVKKSSVVPIKKVEKKSVSKKKIENSIRKSKNLLSFDDSL